MCARTLLVILGVTLDVERQPPVERFHTLPRVIPRANDEDVGSFGLKARQVMQVTPLECPPNVDKVNPVVASLTTTFLKILSQALLLLAKRRGPEPHHSCSGSSAQGAARVAHHPLNDPVRNSGACFHSTTCTCKRRVRLLHGSLLHKFWYPSSKRALADGQCGG